jgi:hypothetical protein
MPLRPTALHARQRGEAHQHRVDNCRLTKGTWKYLETPALLEEPETMHRCSTSIEEGGKLALLISK